MVAKDTGALKSRARVLDSTALCDAVGTQDTVTQLRVTTRKHLTALDQAKSPLAVAVRDALLRNDEYATPGKPPCDWDDKGAREALVDALVRDGWLPCRSSMGRPFRPEPPARPSCWPWSPDGSLLVEEPGCVVLANITEN